MSGFSVENTTHGVRLAGPDLVSLEEGPMSTLRPWWDPVLWMQLRGPHSVVTAAGATLGSWGQNTLGV